MEKGKTKFSVEVNGKAIGSRNSKRNYTHAVVGRFVDRIDSSIGNIEVVSFHSTEIAARRAAQSASSPYTQINHIGRKVTHTALFVEVAVVATSVEVPR